MPEHPAAEDRRIIRALPAILCLLLLAGCSLLRLTYPQLPTIAYWIFDGYLDFDSTQSERARAELADWMRWNRHDQLPEYAALLARARAEVLADTTPAQVCRWLDEGQRQVQIGFEQGLPAAAAIALTLSPQQIDHLRQRMAKRDAELREEFVERPLERRRREAAQRAVDRAEMLYGRLDEAQRERIARDLAASPFDAERWIAELGKRQREAVLTLRRLNAERAGSDAMQAALRALFERVQASPDDAYRAYQRRVRQYGCDFAARLHNATSAEQRRAAAATLAGWENDLRAMAAQAAK